MPWNAKTARRRTGCTRPVRTLFLRNHHLSVVLTFPTASLWPLLKAGIHNEGILLILAPDLSKPETLVKRVALPEGCTLLLSITNGQPRTDDALETSVLRGPKFLKRAAPQKYPPIGLREFFTPYDVCCRYRTAGKSSIRGLLHHAARNDFSGFRHTISLEKQTVKNRPRQNGCTVKLRR